MLVQQLLHRLNKDNRDAGLLFLDLAHAYDYISQEFIMKILETMKFPLIFRQAIETLMKEQTGRCIVNGDLSPSFTVDNGGKQGDPLFPLIYVLANEALAALLETHPSYQGIDIPGTTRLFKSVSYADDTAIGYGSATDADDVLNDVIPIFELASGNEIKKTKSFHILYGQAVTWHTQVSELSQYQTLQVGNKERYLGVQVSHTGIVPDWNRIVEKLKGTFASWTDQGITIAGRTLLLNSCLLAQVWFEATQTQLTTKDTKEINKAINLYFRKGKKTTTVSYERRITVKEHGGLGQIDLATQTRLLQAKWAIRYHSGEDHLWTELWSLNLRELKQKLKTDTHLLYLDRNWKQTRTPDSWDIFPLTFESYKAWHMLDFKMNQDCYEAIAAQPIFNNKYLLNDQATPIRPSNNDLKITSQFEHLPVKALYRETQPPPPPATSYVPGDPTTWVQTKMTPAQLNIEYQVNLPVEAWTSVLSKIPTHIDNILKRGPQTVKGWAATELLNQGEINIGDIYLIYSKNKIISRMQYFTPESGNEDIDINDRTDRGIIYDSQCYKTEQEWDQNWKPILTSLRALAVSAIPGKPKVLGWSDCTPQMHHFSTPESQNSIEQTIATGLYTILKNDPEVLGNAHIKPEFTTLNKKIRKLKSKPAYELQLWRPSESDLAFHSKQIADGKIAPGEPCKMNWPNIWKLIWNCVFVLPKYKQLLYWIITDTLHTGRSVNKWNPGRGICPHCNIVANKLHMFYACPAIQEIWQFIDNIGAVGWTNYELFDPNDPPHLLRLYTPTNMIKLCTLWAIWTTWTHSFFNTDAPPIPPEAWHSFVINKAKGEFIKKVYELPPMIQWIKIAADRRDPTLRGQGLIIPEKEFLLNHSQSIDANPENITDDSGVIPPEFADWIGRGTVLKPQGDLGHPRKLIFNHHEWPSLNMPPDVQLPSLPSVGWQPDFLASVDDN
jgi:hypothetical protein